MEPMEVVQVWDRALRESDWHRARAMLADDATYSGLESDEGHILCTSADEIVGLMRSWKGKLPDVEVVEWQAIGNRVLARLRQPAWGEENDWVQVLAVRDDLITELRDYPTRDAALAASGQTN